MEITKDDIIRNKWHKGFVRNKPISTVVIHGTGGSGTLKYVQNGGRKKYYKRGIALFHYLIERDGVVIEIINPDRWVYHSSSGKFDEETIGIELVNPKRDNSGFYTEIQYINFFKLVFEELMNKNKIDTIMSHNRCKQKYSGGSKKCPGSGFDWQELETDMIMRNLDFNHDPRFESYWNIREAA